VDRCYICGGKEHLFYCFPIPGMGVMGLKLCPEHRAILEKDMPTFMKLYIEVTRTKKRKEA